MKRGRGWPFKRLDLLVFLGILCYMLGTAVLYGFNLFYIYASICINAADQGVDICGIVLNFVVYFWDLTFFFIQ